MAPIVPLLLDQIAARWRQVPADAIQRLVQGANDGVPGAWVDKFGPLCVATLYAGVESARVPERSELDRILRPAGIEHWIFKLRDARTGGYEHVFSDAGLYERRFLAREAGLVFEIRCDPRYDFGVFPDAAAARRLVASLARQKTVLNLFAYTCGFGLAAMQGGAAAVTNVDASKSMLSWGKRNAELNGVDFAVVPDTAQKVLRRLCARKAQGKGVAYDLVVLDPPAFGVGRGDERLVRKLWPELLGAIRALCPQHVLLAFNDFAFRRCERIDALVDAHFDRSWRRTWLDAAGAAIEDLQRLGRSDDPYFAPPVFAHLRREGG